MTANVTGSSLITGAGSGIGQGAAYALARYGSNRIAVADIDPNGLAVTVAELKSRHPGVDVLPLKLDVSSETAVEDAISKTVAAFGRIDIAVNNAGISGPRALAPDVPYAAWRELMNINLDGVWLCQRAEIKQMLKQESRGLREGRGTIINIASMFGVIGVGNTETPATAYSAAKHALVGLTRSEANTFAARGIRINALCPGYVETSLLKPILAAGILDSEIEKTPMKRLAQVDEIGDCIAFLASTSSSFMTGATLVVDGGYTA